MKLLHIISSVNPRHGGPIEGIRQLAAVNSASGHEVEIATLDSPDFPPIQDLPYKVHAFGPSVLAYRYSPRLRPWLKQNAERYDAIVVNGIWQFHSFAAWSVLRHSRTPYIVFTHGMLDPWFRRTYPLKHLKKLLYWPWAEYRVLRDASAVAFTCDEERLLAAQSFALYRVRPAVVGYGIARPPDLPHQKEAFLAAFPMLRDKRIVLFLSRVHEKKGVNLLIEAYAKLLGGDSASRLVIAGPGSARYKHRLQELADGLGIGGRLVWTDMLNGDLKWGAFKAASAFVLPSHQENFGIVVAEAMACGVPILLTNKVNIWRELQEADAALLENDDLPGVESLLARWLAMSQEDLAAMTARAKQCYEEHFTAQAAAARLIALINELTSNAGPQVSR